MSGDSPEVQMARLDERLKSILSELVQAREDGRHQYAKLEDLGRAVVSVENRVVSVENSLAKASPTIDEFITIKHKVQGAGVIGKWVWAIGGGIIGMIFTMRGSILEWLSK